MRWHLPSRRLHYQPQCLLFARVGGDVAQRTHGRSVRRDDNAVASAADPGFAGGIGESDVRETGEEENVPNFFGKLAGVEARKGVRKELGGLRRGKHRTFAKFHEDRNLETVDTRVKQLSGITAETYWTAGARCIPPSKPGGSTV